MGSRVAVVVALLIFLSSLAQPVVFSGEPENADINAPPGPIEGIVVIDHDWVIDSTLMYRNAIIYLTGNMTIKTSGELEMVNTSLVMNLNKDGQYKIDIYGQMAMDDIDGDPMTQDDRSRIYSNYSSYNYAIKAYAGSEIYFHNSQISHHGFSMANKGLVIDTEFAIIDGMLFDFGHYGISVLKNGASIKNSRFQYNRYGVEFYRSEPTFENNTILYSSSRGIYFFYSDTVIRNCILNGNTVGIYEWQADATIISTSISNSLSSGIESYYSSSLIKDSVLANARDIRAVKESFPRVINTTFNHSNVSIGYGLFISVGYYTNVHVTQNGTGILNQTVSIVDQEGNPASWGLTNETGWAMNMAYCDRRLTEFGPEIMDTQKIMAFEKAGDNITFGKYITALSPNSQCIVEVERNPPNVQIWEDDKVIDSDSLSHGQQIIALGDITVDSNTVLYLNNSQLMIFTGYRTTEIYMPQGYFDSCNSSISSIGTVGMLRSGTYRVSFGEYSDCYCDNTTFAWSSEININTNHAVFKNSEILHSSISGLKVSDCGAVIRNLYINWTPRGLYLYEDWSDISNITMENARDYGIQCTDSEFIIDGCTASRSPRAIYSYSSEIQVNNLLAEDNEYALFAYNSEVELYNSSIINSTYYGTYWDNSEGTVSDTNITDSAIAIGLKESPLLVESSCLNGNELGAEVEYSQPVFLNSSFDNVMDITAGRTSHVSTVNCTLNSSRVEVQPSGNIDMGSWANILVKNSTGKPIQGCNVTILDSADNVASSAITGTDGVARAMAFRTGRIYWNRTENYAQHSIMAFRPDTDVQGLNFTTLMPDSTAEVTVDAGAMDWIQWDAYRTLSTEESYDNQTIIMYDNLIIDGGSLVLDNCTLWFFGGRKASQYIYTKLGDFDINNSTIRPISMSAPLQPYRSQIIYDYSTNGRIINSRFSGLDSLSSFSYNFTMSNSRIDGSGDAAIYLDGGNPRIENCTFDFNYDGIWANNGPSIVHNVSLTETGNYGFYAQSSDLDIENINSRLADYGFYIAGEVTGNINQCNASDNENGYYITESSPELTNLKAFNNTYYGLYIKESHSQISYLKTAENKYGLYLYKSWPDILNSEINNNYYGVYAYNSGTYLGDSHLEGNDIGFCDYGGDKIFQSNLLNNGLPQDSAVFIDGGTDQHMSIMVPARAEILAADISITGTEVGADAIFEDSEQQRSAAIYGNRVVWQDFGADNWEIYSYDLAMDSDMDGIPNYLENPPLENDPAMFRITNNSETQGEADIYEDTVVWTDLRNGNYDIYAYTFTNDTIWPVCTHPSVQRKPSIYGDHIVWEDYRNGNYDIYMLNISTGETSQLSSNWKHDMASSIQGNNVVWHSYYGSPSSGETSDIILFNIETWKLTEVTKDAAIQYEPETYGDIIVWHDNRNGNWEIYSYNIRTREEKRLTDQDAESFCPEIYGDLVVYYYHHRTLDFWSVHMINLTTGENTVLERETFGDARPMIYGKKIAWINRTHNDVHILDLTLSGVPENLNVDIGADEFSEFFHIGELDGTEYLDEERLIDSLNKFLGGNEGGMAAIPISIEADGTGRAIIEIESLEYYLPTYIERTEIINSSTSSIECYSSEPKIINSSLSGNCDFSLAGNSQPISLNSSFNSSRLSFLDEESGLIVQNFLHVNVENLTGEPLDINVLVLDNNQTVMDSATGPDGIIQWIVVTQGSYNETGFNMNYTEITAIRDSNIFENNPRILNMAESHWEYFTTDSVGPTISNPFPEPFSIVSNSRNTISIQIKDTIGINISTIKLHIMNFPVPYNLASIPGGYNVSYQLSIPDGTTVRCGFYGEDIHGNIIDYNWEFYIGSGAETFSAGLQEGWNLISIPLQMNNNSVEAVLNSIDGKYDLVKTYSRTNENGPWLTYGPGRPDTINDLKTIDSNMGFWIRATEDCILTVAGSPVESASITLYAGWNLVGYPTLETNQTIEMALTGTGADRVEGIDLANPNLLSELQPDYVMKSGEAYWVHVPADTVWVVP